MKRIKKKYKFQLGVQYAQSDTPLNKPSYNAAYEIRKTQAGKNQIGSIIGSTAADLALPGLGTAMQATGMLSDVAFKDAQGKYKSKGAEIANQYFNPLETTGKSLNALSGFVSGKFKNNTAAADLFSGSLIGTGLGALGMKNPFGQTTQQKVKEAAQKEENEVRISNMTRHLRTGASTDAQSFLAKKGKYKVKSKQPRLIETEGREPIFSPKKPDGTRDLLYYNPNDPTHEEGGVKAVVMPNSYKDDGAKKLKYKTVPADTRDKTPVEKLQTKNTPFSYQYTSPERKIKETILPLIGKTPTLNIKNTEVPQKQVLKNVDEFVGPQNQENIDPREKDYVEYLEPKIPSFPKVNIKEPKLVLKKVPVPLPIVKPKPKPKPVNTKEATYFTYGFYDKNNNNIDDFEEEYNRSSKKMKKFYNKVNLVKIDNRDPYRLTKLQQSLEKLKKDSDVYFLDHAGANLFGLPQDQFAKIIGIYTKHLAKGKSNCYMGSCFGGGHTDDKIINKINKQSKNFKNLYSTNNEIWRGADPSDKYKTPEDVFLPNKKDRYVVKNKNGNRSIEAQLGKQSTKASRVPTYIKPLPNQYQMEQDKRMASNKAAARKKPLEYTFDDNPYAEDSAVEEIASIFDPTGATNWDNVARSYKAYKESKDGFDKTISGIGLGIDAFGAIPYFGKASVPFKMTRWALSKGLSKLPKGGKIAKAIYNAAEKEALPVAKGFWGKTKRYGKNILKRGFEFGDEFGDLDRALRVQEELSGKERDKKSDKTIGDLVSGKAYGAKQLKVNNLNNTALSQNLSGMPSANAANKFILPTTGKSQVARQIPEDRRHETKKTKRSHKKSSGPIKTIDPPTIYEMKPPPPRSTFNTKNDYKKGSKKVKVYK